MLVGGNLRKGYGHKRAHSKVVAEFGCAVGPIVIRSGDKPQVGEEGKELRRSDLALCLKERIQRAADGSQPTHERPSAKESVADASSMAKSRKEKERRNAAFSSSVGSDMRVSLRVVNVRIRSKC